MPANDADPISSEGEVLSLLKLVHIGIIVSLVWKIRFYWYALGVNEEFPLIDPFFPEFFTSQSVLMAAYVAAVASSVLIVVVRAKLRLLILGCLSLGGLSILCVHQNAYNDVTFLTCAWSSLWCLWLTSRLGEAYETLYPRAAWLSHMVLSLIFFWRRRRKINARVLVGRSDSRNIFSRQRLLDLQPAARFNVRRGAQKRSDLAFADGSAERIPVCVSMVDAAQSCFVCGDCCAVWNCADE